MIKRREVLGSGIAASLAPLAGAAAPRPNVVLILFDDLGYGDLAWPGREPTGTVMPAFATGMDLFPTLVSLAGLAMPKDREYDGADLASGVFRNHPGREPLQFCYHEGILQAVRKGRWKPHVVVSYRKTQPPPGEGEAPLLFDAEQGISERRNHAHRQPEVVKQLLALIETHNASIAHGRPQLSSLRSESMTAAEVEITLQPAREKFPHG